MADSRAVTVSLSGPSLEFVRRKVASGEYASEGDVLQEGLEVLKQEEAAREHWIHEVCGPIYDQMKADPTRAIPAAEVERRLTERRLLRKKTA